MRDTPYPGTIQLNVDASNIGQRIFQVHETVPAKAGPLTLLYPQWIPGHHSPTGPIDKFAGLTVHANGKRLEWTRDKYNVYAFHINVPEGASQLDLDFQYLSPQNRREGRIIMTPNMLNVQWELMSLYPAGHNIRMIDIQPRITLPDGWHYATALQKASGSGDQISFKSVTYNVLVDSPMFAGKHYKRIDLAPGDKTPVHLNVFADEADELDATDEQIKVHRQLVKQMYKLYGAHHYDHYDFLLAISDQMSGIGMEHHRSSENGVSSGYFTKWKSHWSGRDLLAHEFNHSWDGKYRRGADLTTPNFNVPMGDSLLWVYEGQTQFWGNVVAARAGLVTKKQGLEKLALVAANYDRDRPGMAWRNIQDTTNDPTIAQRAPLPYRNYQMSEDYYSGGQMIWLAVDGKLRELSHGRRSLDDFAKAFFGMDNGDWKVNTYTFEDVVNTLNRIHAYDWKTFLRSRLDGHVNLSDALASQGWKLVYNDTPSDAVKAYEKRRHFSMMTYSLGYSANDKGEISDVRWDGPAFKAGLSPGMKLIAVNGREYGSSAIKDAVREAAEKGNDKPIKLLVKNFDRYQTLEVDYHGGLQYPHLERIKGSKDYLDKLYAPR
ncbi:MAG: M61 family peptidase [Rhodanobacteraceae bacterium]